ncbi:hypothetical protein SAMN02745823_03894 [Sporobacter termitidis DSM 10068]|uniref:Uncharacterized protein n=1 Tax=Sporobacter termitidis DSM 10068 TaxID=1123282 RepID=A0A1M5ZLL9_9FIRM|nr:hypothetical protein [Sporobacter termitidis]SHI25029.1 hypothetical protein SAMN02745823_03894 [Sporobacter termitidis DSM 10068]
MDLSQYAPLLEPMHDTTVRRFTKVKQSSGYVGDTYVWLAQGIMQCGRYPATDKQSIELYGPRTEQMLRLHFVPGAVINDGDGIAFDSAAIEPTHKVISAKPRKMHTLVVVEVIGVGD